MGKLRELATKIIKGGPEHQARKAEQNRIKLELKQREDQAFYEGKKKGRIAGAKKRGFEAGKREAMGGGGLLGTLSLGMERLEMGAKTLEKGGGLLIGDVDFGGIGQGLSYDGRGTRPRKRTRSKKKPKGKKPKKVVYYY